MIAQSRASKQRPELPKGILNLMLPPCLTLMLFGQKSSHSHPIEHELNRPQWISTTFSTATLARPN